MEKCKDDLQKEFYIQMTKRYGWTKRVLTNFCLLYTSFHEVILQIGDKDNMGSETMEGQLAAKILDEYMKGFQERNPTLRVFAAHLHLSLIHI